MVYLIAYVYGKEDKSAELKKLLIELGRNTMKEPGNVHFIMHEKEDDASTFIFYEVYENEEAFETHLNSPHSVEFSNKYNTLKLGRKDIEVIKLKKVDI